MASHSELATIYSEAMNTTDERKERDQLMKQELLTGANNQFVVNIQGIEAGFHGGEHKSQGVN